ncbi:MAG: adenylosuccinate lyase [bacterium]|nr:adenylosuccinate lyase [bacterium]
MNKPDFTNYQSPFTWRYGSEEMRRVFSETYKYRLWRRIWVELARAQHDAGLVNTEELKDLEKHTDDLDIARILEIEEETKHDVVAAIREFAEKAKIGGGKIHLGATSMDITDNADTIRVKEALHLIEVRLKRILHLFKEKITEYSDHVCMGYTHLQPAEPTTVGYRLAFYAQDLVQDFEYLQFIKKHLVTKGFRGAVGTAAGYAAPMKKFGLSPALITSQVQSRKQDFLVLVLLESICSSLAKFAGDLRILQSANFGEWSEPFGKSQVGSSAMPFKKNPISSEKICSLARYVNRLSSVLLENATLSYLERTLDDSANRRIVIPGGFLATDEILITSEKILDGLVINKERISANLKQYAPFAAMEAILLESVKNGANRQKMHETLKHISMQAWQEIQKGNPNPLPDLFLQDTLQGRTLQGYISKEKLHTLLDVTKHVGNAPQRARKLVKEINKIIREKANV